MGNFVCSDCGNVQTVNKFRTIYEGGKVITINLNTNKEIICDKCGGKTEFKSRVGNFISHGINKFSTMDPLERQASLRERSKMDAQKHKYVDQEREKGFYNG